MKVNVLPPAASFVVRVSGLDNQFWGVQEKRKRQKRKSINSNKGAMKVSWSEFRIKCILSQMIYYVEQKF